MKVANVVPPRLVSKFPIYDYSMLYVDWVLRSRKSQSVDSPSAKYYDYLEHWDSVSTYKILDHSLFEVMRVPPSIEHILEAVIHAHPQEVVLPDVPGKGDDTIKKSVNLMDRLLLRQPEGLKAVMFVPQGESLGEWKACLATWRREWLNQYSRGPYSYTLGLTGTRKTGSLRPDLGLRGHQILHAQSACPGVPIHMLGIDPWWFCNYELPVAWAAGIRSVDTSLPFVLGSQGKLLTRRSPHEFLHFAVEMDSILRHEWRLASLNMELLQHWCDTGIARSEIPASVLEATVKQVVTDPLAAHEHFLPLEMFLGLAGLPAEDYEASYRDGRLHSVRPIGLIPSPDEGRRKVISCHKWPLPNAV